MLIFCIDEYFTKKKKDRKQYMFAQEFLRVCDKEASQLLLETLWCPVKTGISLISHLGVLIITVNVSHILYTPLTFFFK